jgi:steroid delta-isomerase-like uncharacterized protein
MNNKETLKKLLERVWSNSELDAVGELVSPEYTIYHDPGDQWEGQTLDNEAYKNRVEFSRKIFPDLKFVIQELLAENNKVAISWFMQGTHLGDHPQLPATGKKLNMPGMTIYYFDNDGKVNGHWQVVDRMVFLMQLGVLKG